MTAGNPDASLDATVFDAVLTPHRSLGRTGFRLLLCAVCAASTLMSVPFYLLGAWPVIGFFGLDVALLYLFFRLNYRDGRAQERVLLTYLNLFVSRIDPVGRRSEWRFNPLWVRLERDEHADFGLTRLALVERRQEIEVASCLGAAEKADFASALAGALATARRGPRSAPRGS
jgi:uncharacterized membrane protein